MEAITDWDGPSVTKARYARGWSQKALASELVRSAKNLGVSTPSAASVVQTVANWGARRSNPDDHYQMLLIATLGERPVPVLESEEYTKLLVLPDADARFEAVSLLDGLQRAASLTADHRTHLVQATAELRELDRRGNARETVATMNRHIDTLDQLFQNSTKATERLVLARTLGDAEAIAGWAALDRGNLAESFTQFTRAEQAAAFGRDRPLQVFASAQRAFVLIDQGQCHQAEVLVTQLLREYRRSLPPELVVWMLGTLAEVAAVNGNTNLCKNSLEKGRDLLARTEPGGEHPYVVLDDAHFERWEGSCLAKLGDHTAAEVLDRARSQIQPSFERAMAAVLTDLTQAHVANGDLDAAAAAFILAIDAAGTVGSFRQLDRLRALRGLLASTVLAA